MKKNPLKYVFYVLFAGIFLFSLFQILKINYDYEKADSAYAQMQGMYVKVIEDEIAPLTSFSVEDFLPEATQEPFSGLEIDFDALLARNPDVCGWLYCPDTVINYPVVQGTDNDQYLHRDIDGRNLKSGTLFVDARNGELTDDLNYIIYGHNMKNGSMFGPIIDYKDPAYFEEHPVFYYFTPDGDYMLELFAGLVVKGDDAVYDLSLEEDTFMELISGYRRRSTFASPVELNHGDTIITLSTCSYETDDARYIVLARLAPFYGPKE